MSDRLFEAGAAAALRDLVNADGEFANVSRDMTLGLCLVAGTEETLLRFRDGKLAYVGRFVPLSEAIDVYVKAAPDFWTKLLSAAPPPRYQNQ